MCLASFLPDLDSTMKADPNTMARPRERKTPPLKRFWRRWRNLYAQIIFLTIIVGNEKSKVKVGLTLPIWWRRCT